MPEEKEQNGEVKEQEVSENPLNIMTEEQVKSNIDRLELVLTAKSDLKTLYEHFSEFPAEDQDAVMEMLYGIDEDEDGDEIIGLVDFISEEIYNKHFKKG